ncbi:glycosyltransferase family 39 protein [Paenibacillus chitinolyticus]
MQIGETMPKEANVRHAIFALALAAAVLIRFLVAPNVFGYDADVRTFMAWADRAFTVGFGNLYTDPGYFLDYPPGYMYILYLIGAAHHLFGIGWGTGLSLVLLKTPPMLADLLASVLLYRLALRSVNVRQAAVLASLYMLNPAVWINSAAWGQVDSLFMLFVLLSLLRVEDKKFPAAAVYLGLAVLLKPQGLLFGPFFLLALLWRVRHKGFGRELAVSAAAGAAAFLLPALPFAWKMEPLWLPKLYFGTLASYPYASLNAFNLLALLGGNFESVDGRLFSLTYGAWGTLLFVLSLLFVLAFFAKNMGRKGAGLYAGFLFATSAFMLMTKMHERYLFYGLLLLLAAYLRSKDRRLLVLFAGFSVTHFANVGYVLWKSVKGVFHIPKHDPVLMLVSLLNVILFVMAWQAARTWAKKSAGADTRPQAGADAGKGLFAGLMNRGSVVWDRDGAVAAKQPLLTKKDGWLMGGITAVYAVIALVNLGSFDAPQTFWKPASQTDTVVADLGATKQLTRIHDFAGAGEGEFRYEFSMDGVIWNDPIDVKSDYTKVFTWNVVKTDRNARYVKITPLATGFALHEAAFFDGTSDTPLPVSVLPGDDTQNSGEHRKIFDEQAIVPSAPGYKDGTYFDEIYHARTAYEHLHRIEPYESTHPPLGKILISAGIALFGMNPFGWRIVGTLFGVAMLPLMYVMAKRLFGRTEYAAMATFLFAVDFMHFAQTRISTIDVYGVFFIMLMFAFMYRYTTLSFYDVPLRKTLLPLGLAGVTFGIGAASKWIVIYGGAGLAVLLALSLWERFVEYRQARRSLAEWSREASTAEGPDTVRSGGGPAGAADASGVSAVSGETGQPRIPGVFERFHTSESSDEDRERWTRIVRKFPRNTVYTLLFCVVFYVLIPAAIYAASYIPFMLVPGPGHGFADVITYQQHMYSYHSGLVATHPFASSWWEWPLMIRPIWYYKGEFVPPGSMSSIVSFGNPLVWWPGLICVMLALWAAVKTKNKPLRFLLIAYASQYLPWMLVPRLTFIYHYFAMVPFMILMITFFLRHLIETRPKLKRWIYVYLAGAAVLFAVFYPLLSGLVVDDSYTGWLRWLPGWSFF